MTTLVQLLATHHTPNRPPPLLAHTAGMAKEDWPEAEFGPHIFFREHSFLENPSAPASLAAGKVVVAPCATPGESGCGDGTGPAQVVSATVKLQPGMDSVKIKA